ncbi:DUF292-domain-containing protein [Cutaneotrichosporon oleaginosum]|uniref:DUF292-domain-containing protein n=1 Tax=Cutaneotrichosporon oleaginosum TaxID=879819 RepID=A0A0J0XH78_9TREE|nr:DUF292-domain-containing protein [Cutaneotrichosporon oleaginosum]KLT40403.1 DUF292-domain-containing protein [Cutaneotrichosporon oleaginosum]TXT11368.1 hypothetical protein COLE_01778 [Cutaneotrichosporon oleaginosum]
MQPWNAARTKVQIKLSIQRLRTLQEKKLALAKKARRDIADLVAKSRIETAKLRVEGLIQDDIYVELLELLELYLETLQARFGLLDQNTGENPDPSIADAVCAIVYAAPRTELKEVHVLREILMHKFGRNFSLSLQPSDPPPACVPPRILSKLATYTPPAELVEAYLSEIARGYGVPYAPVGKDIPPLDEDDEGRGSGDEGTKEESLKVEGAGADRTPSPANAEKSAAPRGPVVVKKATPEDELAARFERLKSFR